MLTWCSLVCLASEPEESARDRVVEGKRPAYAPHQLVVYLVAPSSTSRYTLPELRAHQHSSMPYTPLGAEGESPLHHPTYPAYDPPSASHDLSDIRAVSYDDQYDLSLIHI